MPNRPPAACTFPTCGTLVYGGGRCPEHRNATRAKRASNVAQGYDQQHRRRFRAGVLRRDPWCQCQRTDHAHGVGPCLAPSTDADHWPVDRRELVRRGLDPNDPEHGRGLCRRCHSSETARLQPGGFNQRDQRY